MLKELQDFNGKIRYGMKSLHDVFGFDFCAPFEVVELNGRFTLGKLEKQLKEAGHTAETSVIAVCIADSASSYRNYYHLATVEKGGKINVEYRPPHYWSRGAKNGDCLDWFCRKSDFEAVRKSDGCSAFVFAQRKELLRIPKQYKVDFEKRYSVTGCRFLTYDHGARAVSNVTLKRLDGGGETVEFERIGRTFYRGEHYPKTLEDLIDKSGYFVEWRRKDLQRRAAALRAEREKAAFLATDNAEKLNALEVMIREKKKALVAALEKAETSDELDAVYQSLKPYGGGFASVVRDFERVREKDEKKSFASVKAFENEYSRIVSALNGEG